MPSKKNCARSRQWTTVLVSLCLLPLSACSEMRFGKAPPIEAVPAALLQPSVAPPFNVARWGDYPIYVEQLHLALKRCNADKAAIAALLNVKTRIGLLGE